MRHPIRQRFLSLLITATVCALPLGATAQTTTNVGTDSIITTLGELIASLAKEVSQLVAERSGSGLSQVAAVAATATGTGAGACGTLATNVSLTPNQSVVSCNGAYTLIFQGDGNVVLYPTSKIGQVGSYWNTGTSGKSYFCCHCG